MITNHQAYSLGVENNQDGVLRKNNPFLSEPLRASWFAGWDEFLPIREQWESDNHDRATRFLTWPPRARLDAPHFQRRAP